MAYVTANGARFHVQRLEPELPEGSPARPPLIVFVHGLVMDNLSSFYYTLAGPAVSTGARVLLYDLRGHGRSERTPAGYTTLDAAADLLAVLDASGVTEPVFRGVGLSYACVDHISGYETPVTQTNWEPGGQPIVDEQLALRTTRQLAERYPRVRIQTPAAAAVFEELRSSIEFVMQRDPGLRVDVEYLTAAVIGVAREIGERMLARQPLDIDGAAAFAANLILRGLPAVPRVER